MLIIVILFISGCCTINLSYEVKPTNCQCKKFDELVRNSFEQPIQGDHFYRIVDISMINLRDIILQNQTCWIGKPYDYVRNLLPPSIRVKNGGSFLYSALEDLDCEWRDCKFLRFGFDDLDETKKIINDIEASQGRTAYDWTIKLHTKNR